MLNDTLSSIFGATLSGASPVLGGDINDAFHLTLTDRTRVFMKANRSASPAFFRAEADGLRAISATNAIRVPRVIGTGQDDRFGAFLLLEWVEPARQKPDYWEAFGHELADMHNAKAARFGWDSDNYIGAGNQINTRRDSWVEFFRDCRLAPQFQKAMHCFDAADRRRITRLLDHLDTCLTEPAHPSLLHGDLWSGNFITGSDGHAWLIDPAVYVGHAEADLAMTELFGGFHSAFYGAYREVNPIEPGYGQRRDLYNLYHLLNHLNLFGNSYLGSVLNVVRNPRYT